MSPIPSPSVDIFIEYLSQTHMFVLQQFTGGPDTVAWVALTFTVSLSAHSRNSFVASRTRYIFGALTMSPRRADALIYVSQTSLLTPCSSRCLFFPETILGGR